MLEALLDKAKKTAEVAEVFYYESIELPISFEANRMKSINASESSGMALRIIKDGRIGLGYSTKLSDSADLDALLESAIESAQFGAQAKFTLPSTYTSNGVATFDAAVEGLSLDSLVALGTDVLDQLRNHDAEFLCDVGATKRVSSIKLLNSNGGGTDYRKSVVSLGASINLTRGEDLLDVWHYAVSCRTDIDPQSVAQRIIQRVEDARSQGEVTTKHMPVLFTPQGLGNTLMTPLRQAFSGKTVLEGASPLSEKLGEQEFDEKLSIYDDGAIDYAVGSSPTDDEGIPLRRTPLIEDGYVRTFIYDLQTAGLAGAEPTGNGERSPNSLPAPGYHNVVVAPGSGGSLQDLIGSVDEGILVEYTLGASMGNLFAGDFSGNVHLGYKIENGKLAGRVKDTMVAGNVYAALKDIAAIGSEPEWVGGGFYAPPILVADLSVSTREG
jgi:PmbA protein